MHNFIKTFHKNEYIVNTLFSIKTLNMIKECHQANVFLLIKKL